MADISIKRAHHFSAEETHSMVQNLADKLVAKHGGDYNWQGNVLNYQRSGVKACVTQGESEISVDVELGLLMKGLKGILTSEINNYLDKLIVS